MSASRRILVFSALFSLAPFSPSFADSANGPNSVPTLGKELSGNLEIQRAMEAVFPALVRIDVVMEEGGGGRMQKARGFGSGAIISPEGYIVTNHHVAGRGTRFRVTLSNREEVPAKFIGTDPLTDIAIIKIDPKDRRDPSVPLKVAKWGDSSKLKVGDVVLAMGSPAGLSQSVTRGIVSNTAMIAPPNSQGGLRLDGENVGDLLRWIGHDAIIFGGNSGGPLVNLQGEIIGVNEVGIGSLGGAIPGNIGKSIAEEIISKGNVTRSSAGIEPQPLLRTMKKEKGVLVATVIKNSPAEKAGIQSGDFITSWDGKPVKTAYAPEDLPLFNALVFATPVGKKVLIEGIRDGKPQKWELTTVLREPASPREDALGAWGITGRDLTELKALESSRESTDGVIVHSLRPGGPAANAKPALSTGDIITEVEGKSVKTLKDLQKISDELTDKGLKNHEALVKFNRGKAEYISVLKLGPTPDKTIIPQASKPWLGANVQVYTRDLAKALKFDAVPGVRITLILPDSPAEKAGLKIGDILTKLDGKIINANRPEDSEIFSGMVRAYSPETEVEFDVLRDGKPQKVKLVFGSTPKSSQEYPEHNDSLFEFTFQDISHQQRLNAELDDKLTGVIVTGTTGNGWAALAGIRSGDVLLEINGEPIKDMKDLSSKLEKIREEKPSHITFKAKNGIRSRFMEIEPRW